MAELAQRLRGTGLYARSQAPEPLLLPLIAKYVGTGEIARLCTVVAELTDQPESQTGWPVLGEAAGEAVAVRHDDLEDQILEESVVALPQIVPALAVLGGVGAQRANDLVARGMVDSSWVESASTRAPLGRSWTPQRLIEVVGEPPGWRAAAVASAIAGTELVAEAVARLRSATRLAFPWDSLVLNLLDLESAQSAYEEIVRAIPDVDDLIARLEENKDPELLDDVVEEIAGLWLYPPMTAGGVPIPEDGAKPGDKVYLDLEFDDDWQPPPAAPPPAAEPPDFGVGAEPDDGEEQRVAGDAEPENGDEDETAEEEDFEEAPNKLERFVNRQVDVDIDGARKETRSGFVAGRPHNVRLWVGPETELAADRPLDEPAPTTVELEQGFLELTISLVYGGSTQDRQVNLPIDRRHRSTDADFTLDVPMDADVVSADVYVGHRGAIIQLLQLAGPVVEAAAATLDRPGILLESKAMVRPLPDTARDKDTGTAVVQDDGKLMTFGPAGSRARFSLPDTSDLIAEINEKLFNASQVQVRKSPETVGTTWKDNADAEVVDLLRFMARRGQKLWAKLDEAKASYLPDPIQFVNLEPEEMVPLELVYDKGRPTDDAELCDHWEDRIAQGESTCICVSNAQDHSDIICPLGFWSLSKVIERHHRSKDVADPHFATSTSRAPVLPAIEGAAYGAAPRVDELDVDAVKSAIHDALAVDVQPAATWTSWCEQIKRRPQLLILLPHHGLTPEDKDSYLEIGQPGAEPGDENRLFWSMVSEQHVTAAEDGTGPIVLILGCKTAMGETTSWENFALTFQARRAAVVVATLSRILGKHAAPLAVAFINALLASSTATKPTGEIMRDVRATMFREGYLMALALVAFGDGDWALAGQDERGDVPD